ncbi:hypothetical protein BAE44_0006425 [Dichanthelium oligosanthes]|uniref:C2H2-type domain-containing protein n=1 Tax=Dichanthelium oligosanthes TaxID=888268 RepID=A0A1E5W553_9POAL|nr:hypothetical protein BAE44_0006425 [Dichanthelium oligosanthes]
MNLHSVKRKHKKKARSTLSLPNIVAGAGGYGLRERRHSAWLSCDSSDDEYLTRVPKTACQLCFRVFASCYALSAHMRVHVRHERKMVAKEASRESNGYCDHNVDVSTPVKLTYGIQEVNAARVLLMISGHCGMDSPSEHCDEDYEIDGNLAYRVQKSEMELDYSCHGRTGDAELMMPESPCSDVKPKFSSLSQVLKATETHDCKLCGKVFTSSKGLASHKKFHKVPDREKVAGPRNSAVPQTGQKLLEVDSRLLCLNLPGFSDRNYRSRNPKSAQTPWWTARGFRSERLLGIV